jgi:hypothetical protein
MILALALARIEGRQSTMHRDTRPDPDILPSIIPLPFGATFQLAERSRIREIIDLFARLRWA